MDFVRVGYFIPRNGPLNGHLPSTYKDQSRLNVKKYSFSQRAISECHKLSTDCVHDGRVNIT